MLKALTAFLQAATAFLKVWPLWKLHELETRYEELEDEILRLGDRGDPAGKLRIELLNQRKQRLAQSIRTLRSANRHPGQGS